MTFSPHSVRRLSHTISSGVGSLGGSITLSASTSSFRVWRVCCMSSRSSLDTCFMRGERGSHLPFSQEGEAGWEGERDFMRKIVVMRVRRIAGRTRVVDERERSIEEEFNRFGWS
jgi:hypothetical protein